MGIESPKVPNSEWVEKYKNIHQNVESATSLDEVYDLFEQVGVQMSYGFGAEFVAEPSTQQEKLKALHALQKIHTDPNNLEDMARMEAVDAAVKKLEELNVSSE